MLVLVCLCLSDVKPVEQAITLVGNNCVKFVLVELVELFYVMFMFFCSILNCECLFGWFVYGEILKTLSSTICGITRDFCFNHLCWFIGG